MSCYQKFYTNQIHSSSLLCQLATMWKSQVLCDAIIRTGPVVTKAHRVVLVAACPMLQSMENASMGSHLEVRLASDIKQDSINTFLQYLYEGFMMLTEENCKDVEKIARLLQVDSVTKCCMDFYKCLTVKTGQSHPGDQYKYTSYDMLEFRHVRSSDIQKTVHDRVMKRGSDFTRPSSPSHKRQKIHKPSSPSFEILSTSHRADDTLSMAHSYGGAAPDPWERVPRLGAGGRHNVSSQPGVIDIVEDSIEIIQTEQPEKDARGNVRSDSRMKQKSVSIAVSSQMNSVADVQIVNVSDKNDTSSTKQNSANSNNTAPTTTTVSSSGRGSITVSPLAIFNNDTSNQTTMSRDSSHFPKSQPQSSPEVQDAHFVHRSSDPSATSTPSQPVFPTSMSPISRPPAISQAKPYAAGSAQQAAMSPGESNSTAKGPRLQTSRIEQEKNTLSPASFEKGQENSSKVDSETPSISADKAPDISIVKIEQEEDNTGGLDMYVDIPEDGMMRIRRGMDDTEDGSDLEHDMMREEASNEGSNVSGDQNNSWYIGQFKGQDSDESLLDIGGDGGVGDSVMYASGAGDHVSDMETTSKVVAIFRSSRSSEHPVEGEEAVNRIREAEEVSVNHIQWAIGLFRVWMKLRGEDPSFENLPAYRLNDFLCQFYEEIITDRSLAWFPVALNRHLTGPPFYRNIDILLNPAFETSNAILETKNRMFSVQLNDQHCDDASKISITFGHLKTIYSSDILCCKDPTSLQNKVWMDVNLYFGGFTRQLLRNMKKTSFILNTDPTDGRMYYRMIDDNVSDKNTARMYEQPGNPFCPVQSIMMYLSKLHPDSDVFFQQPGGQEDLKRGMWYSCQPIGKNSHSSKLTVICKQIGINQQFRNTSLRHLSRYVHSKLPDYTPAYSDKIARILVGDDNDPLTWI